MIIQLLVNGISLGAVYALIAVGFAIVFSVLKFSNFAHGGMISACAYLGFFFQRSINPTPPLFVTFLVTGMAGMVIAVILDYLAYKSIRRNKSPKIYYFLASLTFSILITQILNIWFSKNPFSYPKIFENTTFNIGNIRISTMDSMILVVSIVILVLLLLLINKTKMGLAIRAVAINPDTSRLMGINSSVVVIAVFLIAGFLAGISGVLLGAKYSVYPDLGQTMMIKGFIPSVIGGLGSLGGAIIAAFALGIIDIMWTYCFGAMSTPVFLFIVMLLFLFLRPQGVSGKIIKEKV